MSISAFPSPLTQVVLNGNMRKHTVTLPIQEQFRVNNIFFDHEYSIKKNYLPSTPITVVDVGANVGLFALYMELTHSIDTIHCFEPCPNSFELLRKNIADFKNIHIHPLGLSNRNGSALLKLHPKNSGENKIVKETHDSDKTIEVRICSAEDAFSRLGLTYIDVLKIDTEGSEIQILESLKQRLDYIGIILLEYHSEADRRNIDRLLDRFKLIGAKVEMMNVGTLKYINQRLLRNR